MMGLRQIIFASNHSIKDKKYSSIKCTISNSKTTANETVSREERTKREKSKSSQLPSSRELASARNFDSKQLVAELVKSKLKQNFHSIGVVGH